MLSAVRAQFRRIGAIQPQRRGNNDPVLVTLEHALAIAELARRVADLANRCTVEKTHRVDSLLMEWP